MLATRSSFSRSSPESSFASSLKRSFKSSFQSLFQSTVQSSFRSSPKNSSQSARQSSRKSPTKSLAQDSLKSLSQSSFQDPVRSSVQTSFKTSLERSPQGSPQSATPTGKLCLRPCPDTTDSVTATRLMSAGMIAPFLALIRPSAFRPENDAPTFGRPSSSPKKGRFLTPRLVKCRVLGSSAASRKFQTPNPKSQSRNLCNLRNLWILLSEFARLHSCL